MAVGDFNGDGKPDLAVTNYLNANVSVLLNTTAQGSTTASFATQKTFATGGRPGTLAVADVNGDGKPDLAVPNFYDNNVGVLLNTTPATPPPPPSPPADVRRRVDPADLGGGGPRR